MIFDLNRNQQTSYKVNTLLEALVIFMMIIFYLIGAKILAIFSIFVAGLYLFNYFLISKMYLRGFIWSTYGMLTTYMAVCTVFLGYNYGFALYSLSTIALIYYVRYIATKSGLKDPKPNFWTILIILSCALSSIFAVYHGPIYKIEGIAPIIFLFINISCVCFFLGIYSKYMIDIIIDDEQKLTFHATHDSLTQLPNRFKMRNDLQEMIKNYKNSDPMWLAMIDIDKFKVINDTYSHKSGDDVLKALSKIMQDVCKDALVSRWGGEEFLICGKTYTVSPEIIEVLRKTVEETEVISNEQSIHFTITSGVSIFQKGQTMDLWIIDADNKLYKGKENGRNRVIY